MAKFLDGHRELIIYLIDLNGEPLVFNSLFCISQCMWVITICLKFKPKHVEGEMKKNISLHSLFQLLHVV